MHEVPLTFINSITFGMVDHCLNPVGHASQLIYDHQCYNRYGLSKHWAHLGSIAYTHNRDLPSNYHWSFYRESQITNRSHPTRAHDCSTTIDAIANSCYLNTGLFNAYVMAIHHVTYTYIIHQLRIIHFINKCTIKQFLHFHNSTIWSVFLFINLHVKSKHAYIKYSLGFTPKGYLQHLSKHTLTFKNRQCILPIKCHKPIQMIKHNCYNI